MKRLLTITALCLSSGIGYAQDARGGKIEWRHDLETGLREARQEQRPVILYFTADW